jgi:DNA-binding NarL/FixJ family response regulator
MHRVLKVLVVDDNQAARKMLRGLLELSNFVQVVGEAANGQAAIEMSRVLHPDLVVMDADMPIMDGFAATKRLKLERLAGRVIMVSSFGGSDVRHRAEMAGADAFLDKESVAGEIVRAVAAEGRQRVPAEAEEYPGEAPPPAA